MICTTVPGCTIACFMMILFVSPLRNSVSNMTTPITLKTCKWKIGKDYANMNVLFEEDATSNLDSSFTTIFALGGSKTYANDYM